MTTRTAISVLVAMVINAVLFGVGAVTVLSIPALNELAAYLLPAVVAVSFAVSPIIAYALAPRLRARWQKTLALHERHASPH